MAADETRNTLGNKTKSNSPTMEKQDGHWSGRAGVLE